MNKDSKDSSLDILLKQIEDPYSIHALHPKNHALRAYVLGMFQQLKETVPELAPAVKEEILSCLHPDYQHEFFETLEQKPNLFIDGASYEVIRRAISRQIRLDDCRTIKNSLEFSAVKAFGARALGKTFGINFLLHNITKATPNMSDAITIRRIDAQSAAGDDQSSTINRSLLEDLLNLDQRPDAGYDSRPYFFEYISNPCYTRHVQDHFGEEQWKMIEDINYAFTMRFMELLPVLFLKESGPEGIKAGEYCFNDARFFAVYYPKQPFWRRIFPSTKKKDFHQALTVINHQTKEEWNEYRKMLQGISFDYATMHGAVEKEIHLAIERFRDISLVDPLLYNRVKQGVEQLNTDLKELKEIDHHWEEISISLNFSDPEDLLKFSSKIREPYQGGAAFEHKLFKLKKKLESYEQRAVNILIEGYRSAIDREKFLHDLLEILDHKDTFIGHVYRVADLAEELGRRAGLDPETAKRAGLFHDFGKILVPREVLNKPGKFDRWEREIVNKHAAHGQAILKGMGLPQQISDSAGYHHEFWDGSKGYPKQKSFADIPLISRLISYADVCDAIAGSQIDRSYDRINLGFARDWSHAVITISECQNSQFDPGLFPFFQSMVKDGFISDYYEQKKDEAKK